jgi:ribose transport system substrate-binding protein
MTYTKAYTGTTSAKTRAAACATAALIAAGALAGCSSSGSSGSGSDSSSKGLVAFIPGATGVGFYTALEDGAKAEATKLGYGFLYQGSPDFTAAAQTPIVDSVCAKSPKILLIAPTDPVALRPAIQTCLNAGVKVVTVDTALTDTSGLVSAITSDNIQGGEAAAGVIAKALDDKGQVAVMSLDGTTTTQVERVKGLTEGLAQYPGISVVANEFTGQAETASKTATTAILTAHPQVGAFFGAAEPNAEGAAEALTSAGLSSKDTVVGYDADPSAVALLKTGAISALVIQQPQLEGQLGVEYAADAISGDTSAIKTSVLLPNVLVTTTEAGGSQYTKYYYPAG